MAKKSSKTKLRNKHQNKQSKGRKKKRTSTNKTKIQNVTVQRKRETNEQIRGTNFHGLVNGDASLEDIDHLIDDSGVIRSLNDLYRNDDEKPPLKRRKVDGTGEQEYENVPRKLKKSYLENDGSGKDTVHLLPIKNKEGLIHRTRKADDVIIGSESKEDIEKDEDETLQETVQSELTMIEIYAKREELLRENKMIIAKLCEEMLENPDANIKNLKKLLDFCNKGQILVIQKLALISLCEIFKDIVPGYRIRPLSEQEQTVRVSKDVRKLRDFEEGIIVNYKKYLDILEELVASFAKKKAKSNIGNDEVSSKVKVNCGLATTAAKCMSELLLNLSHFNYRTNLIVAIVSRMHLDGEKKEIGHLFTETIKKLFKSDEIGDVSIEALKVISRIMKSKITHITPQVLETLLCLNINSQMVKEAENRESKIERIKKRKEEVKKMSRNERKRKKMEVKLDKELQETEAVESREKLLKFQTEILKTLFVIYFRILKQEKRTALLTPVLKGLSKFAHLINVDFFNDLMKSLKLLINSGELTLTQSLNCVLTTFKILSGQGESLNIDLHHFYLHLYNSLVNIGADCDQEDFDLCVECLDIMLLKRRKQISLRRILGFLKRISTIALHLESNNLFAFLSITRGVLQLNPKCDILLDSESMGRGIFQPELEDPEHCNADSTALWELPLLSKHYCLDARDYTHHLIHGAPSQGQGALPKRLAQRSQLEPSECPPLQFYMPTSVPATRKVKKFTKHNDSKCGGALKGFNGGFQSPNQTELASLFNNSIYECRWKISLPSTRRIILKFTDFSVNSSQITEKCNVRKSVAIVEHLNPSIRKETLLCGNNLPPPYHSESSSIEVILRDQIPNNRSFISSFKAIYISVVLTPMPNVCGSCGGVLNVDSGMIKSPNFPNSYSNNCDCKWTIYIRRGYVIKFKFLTFSLEKDDKVRLCRDFLIIYDGPTSSSSSLGKFCGNQNPGSVETTNTIAFVHFHSNGWTTGHGFEITFQAVKDTKDLSSLRSIAAILGGVSFGIFLFLLLCSVIYKKYISNDDRRDTCASQNGGENDYLDAVQAAAPPSYHAVMADPEHYPRTPEVTPSASPAVTPSLLRRNNIRSLTFVHDTTHHRESLEEVETNGNTTPPPPYPGNVTGATAEVDEVLVADLPPPPTYEMVSDSEELSDTARATPKPSRINQNNATTYHPVLSVNSNQDRRASTRGTGDECRNSQEHVHLNSLGSCRITPTYQSCSTSTREACLRSTASRPLSDSFLLERSSNYLVAAIGDSSEESGTVDALALTERVRAPSSDDSLINYHNCYDADDERGVGDNNSNNGPFRRNGRRGRKSASTPLFQQLMGGDMEHSDVDVEASPRIRHHSRSPLFDHRHHMLGGHFTNRVQPDSPTEDCLSASRSPRILGSTRRSSRRHRLLSQSESVGESSVV
eukprot:gene5157-5807_t